jgi:hypothetical protein
LRAVVDFVEEVEEQLRAERYASFARRGLPWFVAALVVVIAVWLGVWGYHSWRDRNVAAASVAYDKAITELAAGDEIGAYNALAPVAKDGPAAYRTLALIQQGNIRAAADKTADAAALYDDAAKAAPGAFLGDLARLKAALVLMDTAPYPQLETRFKALIGDAKPYDLQAREALALAKMQAGRAAEARGDLNALSITLGVTPAIRARAQNAIALIDAGQAGTVAAAARAAATMPPPSAATLSALGGAPVPSDGADGQPPAAGPAR